MPDEAKPQDHIHEAVVQASLAARGIADAMEQEVANTRDHAKVFLAQVEAWFEAHFGVSASEAAANAKEFQAAQVRDPAATESSKDDVIRDPPAAPTGTTAKS